MQICLFRRPDSTSAMGLVQDGYVYDLSAFDNGSFGSFADLICSKDAYGSVAACVQEVMRQPGVRLSAIDIPPAQGGACLMAPITNQEVWGAGVTYLRSRDARIEESAGGGSFYDKVYDAVRPELFLKATPARVAGPNAPIRIRSDSRWTVPEPELALVINSRSEVVGFTVGNDVSARDIEGENPLYLPQAKIYCGSCALGPVVTLASDLDSVREWSIRLCIHRGREVCFEGNTSLDQMKREFRDLAGYLFREQSFPEGVILLTGTGIVPPDDIALQDGDRVEITISGIGTLRNLCSSA